MNYEKSFKNVIGKPKDIKNFTCTQILSMQTVNF